jgi:hypothetical protein
MNLYCPYCGEPQGEKRVCCGEVHFMTYDELDEDMKEPPKGYTAEELDRDNPHNQWMYND